MNIYNEGQHIYYIRNNYEIVSGTIIRAGGGFYTIKLDKEYGNGGTRLKAHRLFKTEHDAKIFLNEQKHMHWKQQI